jgi:hypothetical protein
VHWRARRHGRRSLVAWSNAEISDAVVISEDTTKSHIRHILAKLNPRDRAQSAPRLPFPFPVQGVSHPRLSDQGRNFVAGVTG